MVGKAPLIVCGGNCIGLDKYTEALSALRALAESVHVLYDHESALVVAGQTAGPVATFSSNSSPSKYTVKRNAQGVLTCDCPSWRFKKPDKERSCRHVEGVSPDSPLLLDGWKTCAMFHCSQVREVLRSLGEKP